MLSCAVYPPPKSSASPSSSRAATMNLKHLPFRVALPPIKAKRSPRIIRATPPNAASTKSKTKLPRFVQFLRPRRSTVLSTIRISATVVGKVGSATPVPLIQPIADGVNKIVEYCEVRAQAPQCRLFQMSTCARRPLERTRRNASSSRTSCSRTPTCSRRRPRVSAKTS